MRLFLVILSFAATLFLLIQTPLKAQQVHTYVNSDSIQVGDVIHFTIVTTGTYSSIQYPDENDFTGDIELIERQRFQVRAGRDSLVYRLQFFGNEDITIPELDVQFFESGQDTIVSTTAVPLFFKTSLSDDDEEFRPFKPIFDFAALLWPYILGLLILILASYFGYRWFQNQQQVEPVPEIAPEPFVNPVYELESDIKDLEKAGILRSEKDFETFYVKLGDSIRRYLKRVYTIKALEMTSGEIIRSLEKELAHSSIIKHTKRVLNESDIVKFANFNPGNEQAQKALETAKEFLETVKVIDADKIDYLKHLHEEKSNTESDPNKISKQ